MRKKIIISLLMLFVLSILSFFVLSNNAYALGQNMFEKVGVTGKLAGYTYQDPRVIISLIIKAAIGLMGLIFFILIVAAGVSWMTSAGEAEKVKKAQERITHAAIGLLIVILAFAISSWLINTFVTATTPAPAFTPLPTPAVMPGTPYTAVP